MDYLWTLLIENWGVVILCYFVVPNCLGLFVVSVFKQFDWLVGLKYKKIYQSTTMKSGEPPRLALTFYFFG